MDFQGNPKGPLEAEKRGFLKIPWKPESDDFSKRFLIGPLRPKSVFLRVLREPEKSSSLDFLGYFSCDF